jgi:hypothetical protein
LWETETCYASYVRPSEYSPGKEPVH